VLNQIDPSTPKPLSDASTNEPSSDMLVKHNNPTDNVLSQIDPPTSKPLSDVSTTEPSLDMPTSKPSTSKSVPDKPHGPNEDMRKTMHLLVEKRAEDAIRYLELCATAPSAFRQAIDALPKPSIKRIYDVVCNAANGDGQVKLSPKQRRLCKKYRADSHASSKTKRRLLRNADKQTVRSVLVPLILQNACAAGDSGALSAMQ
jgi:hypothetical protein